MLDEILDDEKFALLMKMHVYECIDFLLEKGLNFSVVALACQSLCSHLVATRLKVLG